ncbi:hypothetical protein SAMN04487948_105110 [Halogranum amylolyticum]|uniref:HTH bat-type domain-containing protein n=1 Tax=Halogranum amylolyticum TaxID=660520 RepID=A0A1H8SIB7_9EURY|nr:helix-turn-helix domain-containing protein [Halogranum amylolyticum]SEO78266.1 hypothetical protein SAMN04487948_105110 [Halogranum amylolyticum]
MSEQGQAAGTRLTLELWHPNCWALEATARADGSVLAHAIYSTPTTADGLVNGLFTAYADSDVEVEALLDAVRESPHAGTVRELQERFGGHGRGGPPGSVVREFFLEYDPRDMICPVLREQGFVHGAPVRIEGGREFWEVCFAGDRRDVEPRLDDVREAAAAEIDVVRITAAERGDSERERRRRTLTTTQRKVFDLARDRGYYRWPRGVSTRELADECGVAKTTLLEHLRKAEAKLLDPNG